MVFFVTGPESNVGWFYVDFESAVQFDWGNKSFLYVISYLAFEEDEFLLDSD